MGQHEGGKDRAGEGALEGLEREKEEEKEGRGEGGGG